MTSKLVVRQEAQDVSGKETVVIGAGALLVGLGFVAVVAVMLWAQRRTLRDAEVASAPASVSLEQSTVSAAAAGQKLQQLGQKRLRTWGWVERGRVAHIPVTEARDWLLTSARDGSLSWTPNVVSPDAGQLDSPESQP